MRKKCCPKCTMTSFSAYKEEWICPYCNADMSQLPDYSINDNTDTVIIRDVDHEDKKTSERKLLS